jgi:hypothetical protein
MENVQKLTCASFRALHDKMDAVFHLINNDLELALASEQQDVCEGENRDVQEEDRWRKQLAGEVQELKKRHEELLGSISGY